MLNTPFAKTLMLLAVAAVIVAAFIYRAIEPRYGLPQESSRVKHPAGFSVVAPLNWERNPIPLFDGDLTRLYTLSFYEGRSEVLPAELTITRLPGPPTDLPPELAPEPIAGRPTYRKLNKRTRYTDATLWFQEGDTWFRATMSVPHASSVEDLYAYVATVRNEAADAPPLTRPAPSAPAPTTVTP